jgi:hypothetical protein
MRWRKIIEAEAISVVTPVLPDRNGPQDLQATMKGALISTPYHLPRNGMVNVWPAQSF